jgi:hypothetical protein
MNPQEFLKSKMSAEDFKAYDEMCAKKDAEDKKAKDEFEAKEKKDAEDKRAKDAEEEAEKKKAEDKRAKDKKAKDAKRMKDADPDDGEKAEDDTVEQKTLEGAQRANALDENAVAKIVKLAEDKAIASVTTRLNAVRDAERFVAPWVGQLSPDMAFDSAESVLSGALVNLGFKAEELTGLPASGLKLLFRNQPKPGERTERPTEKQLALDAKAAGGSVLDDILKGIEAPRHRA